MPKLPYAMDALEPHLSKETLEYHYGKHHVGYWNKLRLFLVDLDHTEPNSSMLNMTLLELIEHGDSRVFNNAA